MRDRFPETCARCHARLRAHTMSRFNTDTLCRACADDETHAPGYARARAAEQQAVQHGDLNYPGIGLTAEDRVVLAARRAARVARGEED